MRNYFLFICIIFCSSLYSQHQINGLLTDSKTGTPLPFANVISEQGNGTITDRDGKFTLEQSQPFTKVTLSYLGYVSKIIDITRSKSYYAIALDENVENLGEVVISTQDNPALKIIRKAIENKKRNNPEKALNSFQFKSYSKLLVTANPDSISSAIDTVYKIENGKKRMMYVDSSNYELKKQLERSHLYITEKVSEYKFTKEKGKRENILASRMAGFEQPIYRVMAIKMQSFSFYDETYTIFGTSYTNPVANNALKEYNFTILDTLHAERDAYMIYYKPKEKGDMAGLQGVLYIDTESFALQKAVAQLKGTIDISAEQNFVYMPHEKVWFPDSKKLLIKKGDTDEAVSLFGGKIKLKPNNEQVRDSTIVYSENSDDSDNIHMILTEQNSDIDLNTPVEIKGRGLAIAFDDKAFKQSEDFWEQYRTDSLTQRGRETYIVIDSISEAENFKKNVNSFLKITEGYLPTKYIDLDLRYLIKYNNYEGFRLGMGGVTNTNFSSKYRIHGYTVYGTKDHKFKYGVGAEARLNKFTNTWFGAGYSDDLTETGSHPYITDGRAFYVFQPRLFNIETFHKNENVNINLSHNITSQARLKVQLDKNYIAPTYDYLFHLNGKNYHNFHTTTVTAALSWQPFSEFMLTPDGLTQTSSGYPNFTFQASQGISGLLNGDFNYTKINFRAYYEIQPLDKGTTSFTLNSGVAFGELPITELYHTSPNNPNKMGVLSRFSVAGIDNFETMYFNEFFSDKYLTLMGRHEFKPFALGEKFKPQAALFTKFAIGNVTNAQRHDFLPFKSMEKGYYESGMEVNNIFLGFGLSGAYRYGPYHLTNLGQNISFKFTYNFALKF